MAIPPNTTPATAVEITSLPFSLTPTLDVSDAPAGTGYASTCAPDQFNAVWYKYTAKANENLIAINVEGENPASNYEPVCSIWVGTLPTLTQYIITSGSQTQNFCEDLFGELYYNVPIVPGTTYYFQINDSNNITPLGGNLAITIPAALTATVPTGSLIVTDDSDGYPAACIDKTTGAFINYVNLPAGESADWIPNVLCLQNGEADTSVALYDTTLTQIATVDFSPAFVIGIRSNKTDKFYVMTQHSGGALVVHEVSSAGVAGTTWTLPVDSILAKCFAVSRDSNTIYYGSRTASAVIHAYSLMSSSALPDLTTAFGTEYLVGFSDGFIASDGSIFFGYGDAFSASPKIRRFDSSGTLLTTYTLTTGQLAYLNHFADDPDGVSFWVWGGLTGPTVAHSTFHQIRISDGVVLTQLDNIPTIGTTGSGNLSGEPFNISNSCPLIMLAFTFTPPVSTGNLVIGKLTTPYNPSQSFAIVAGGGLTPTNITLRDGESQVYADIPAGSGYTVVETPPSDNTVEIFTSNGSPADNITVAAGEYVTVLVLNTLHALYSGLYILTPGRTNDNILQPDGTGQAVKFPDPFIITGMIPEEE